MAGHRRSIRLPEYDYASCGAYYVTICTHDRECMFGEIVMGKSEVGMILNEQGKMIKQCWRDINDHFMDVRSDDFVVMPNHIHGILIVGEQSTVGARFPRPRNNVSLGKIVAYFKYTSTKRINRMHGNEMRKIWQRNYYERIIRHDGELNQIRKYIQENPNQWEQDGDNPSRMQINRRGAVPAP